MIDHTLQGGSPFYSAASHAIINARKCDESYALLNTHFAIDCAKPGTTEDHLKSNGEYYKSILQSINDAKSNAGLFGKSLFVDCVKLSVLSGQTKLSSNSADYFIAAFVHELRADIYAKTGQATFPKFLISPINDASSELCIAKGELTRHWVSLWHPPNTGYNRVLELHQLQRLANVTDKPHHANQR